MILLPGSIFPDGSPIKTVICQKLFCHIGILITLYQCFYRITDGAAACGNLRRHGNSGIFLRCRINQLCSVIIYFQIFRTSGKCYFIFPKRWNFDISCHTSCKQCINSLLDQCGISGDFTSPDGCIIISNQGKCHYFFMGSRFIILFEKYTFVFHTIHIHRCIIAAFFFTPASAHITGNRAVSKKDYFFRFQHSGVFCCCCKAVVNNFVTSCYFIP